MHSDLKIVDPIWTTAYITRNHGYMIYDTLFATDAKGEIHPQMLDKYDVSADKLTYTMTLRDGLLWHDGKPVTAEDCVASIKRWAVKDSMGQKLMTFVKEVTPVNPKTIRLVLTEPTGLVLAALGKPSSTVPFMMPKRVAETDPNTQISDFTGSGPFVFKRDEWKPGDKAVYVKFAQYKPRAEAASALAGGKVVKVDRVEWRAISDQQTAINALLAGELDYLESPSHDLLPVIKSDANVKLVDINPLGNQYTFRLTRCTSLSTTSRCARRWCGPSTRRTSSRPSSATRPTTRSVRRSFRAARCSPPPRAWRVGCSWSRTSARRRRC